MNSLQKELQLMNFAIQDQIRNQQTQAIDYQKTFASLMKKSKDLEEKYKVIQLQNKILTEEKEEIDVSTLFPFDSQ